MLPWSGEEEEAATSVAKEGAIPGGSELVGAGLVGGARVVGQSMMGAAIRPSTSLKLFDDVANQPLADADMNALDGMIRECLKNHPGPLTPTGVKELQSAAQEIGRPIFRARRRGEIVSSAQAMEGRFNQAVATGTNKAMRTIEQVGPAESRTQSLIGAERAIRQAEMRRLPAVAEAAGPTTAIITALLSRTSELPEVLRRSVIGYLAARGLMSPRVLSRGALVLTQPTARRTCTWHPARGTRHCSKGSISAAPPPP